jgi:murein DD-endopeptidase MepM/ murein hydrolase activator NlpD
VARGSLRHGRLTGRGLVRLAVTPALALALITGGSAAPVGAVQAVEQPGPGVNAGGMEQDLDAIIEQLREELGEGNEAMVRAGADLRLAEAMLPGARATAAEAAELLGDAMRKQEQAAQLRGQAQVQLVLAEQESEAAAAALAEQQAQLARLATEAYQSGGGFHDVAILLDATSPADFADRLMSLDSLAASQQSVLAQMQAVQQTHTESTAVLTEVRDAMAASDKRAQKELATVRTLEARARATAETVGYLIAARERALAAARAASVADADAAARRQSISSELAASLAARARQVGASGDGSGVAPRPGALLPPVNGRLSSPFGMRIHPITGEHKLHTGADLSAPCGTPIAAARKGEVVAGGWNSAYGWRAVVSHGKVGGVLLTTTYNHMEGLDVAVGDRLSAGETLGRVGSTGYSTGCHLHLELYVNSSLVDPMPWL